MELSITVLLLQKGNRSQNVLYPISFISSVVSCEIFDVERYIPATGKTYGVCNVITIFQEQPRKLVYLFAGWFRSNEQDQRVTGIGGFLLPYSDRNAIGFIRSGDDEIFFCYPI